MTKVLVKIDTLRIVIKGSTLNKPTYWILKHHSKKYKTIAQVTSINEIVSHFCSVKVVKTNGIMLDYWPVLFQNHTFVCIISFIYT